MSKQYQAVVVGLNYVFRYVTRNVICKTHELVLLFSSVLLISAGPL